MANAASNSGDAFDMRKIRQLVGLMQEYDLSEIDLRQNDTRIRLARLMDQAPVAAEPRSAAAAAAPPPAAPAASDANLAVIKSPMVGTFYVSPNPESPPFVKVGDRVSPDSTICIIEAMKVFNEIPAELSGQIAAVLVENGAPVEFGQPLFKVDTRQ